MSGTQKSIFVRTFLAGLSSQEFAQQITYKYLELDAKFDALEATLRTEYELKLKEALGADQIQDEEILAQTVQEKVAEVSGIFQAELDRISAEAEAKAQIEKEKADSEKATQEQLISALADAGLVVDESELG
jgi:DNA integrity scanning protein DisA with diadenylate cyclase activity